MALSTSTLLMLLTSSGLLTTLVARLLLIESQSWLASLAFPHPENLPDFPKFTNLNQHCKKYPLPPNHISSVALLLTVPIFFFSLKNLIDFFSENFQDDKGWKFLFFSIGQKLRDKLIHMLRWHCSSLIWPRKLTQF